MIFNVTGGGGTSLNFKVVGGTSQPTAPKENTIWVNTSTAIPSWAFSATEPESPVAGMVWFLTGTSSSVAFNALRKNDIQVCPNGAKQYIGGQWVYKEAKAYQGGEWKHLRTYLYTNGDECEPISGGWSIGNILPAGYDRYGAATLTKNETSMLFSGTMNNIWTGNEINLSGVSALRLIGTQPTARYVEFFVADKKANGYARKVYGSNDRTNPTANVDVTIDVSDVESGWIAIAIFETQTNLTITEIEMIY